MHSSIHFPMGCKRLYNDNILMSPAPTVLMILRAIESGLSFRIRLSPATHV